MRAKEMSLFIDFRARVSSLLVRFNLPSSVSFLFLFILASIPTQYRYRKWFRPLAEALSSKMEALPAYFEKSIYYCISDVAIIVLFLLLLFYRRIEGKKMIWEGSAKFLTAFLIVSLLSITLSSQYYYPIHYIRLIQFFTPCLLFYLLAQGCEIKDISSFLKKGFVCIALAGAFQASVGISQYYKQDSVGLKKLGEMSLHSSHPHLASIPLEDKTESLLTPQETRPKVLLRAHGTFVHPNVLGGFLVFSLIASYALFFRMEHVWARRCVLLAILLQIATLFLSFSRSALFAWVLGSLCFFILYPKTEMQGSISYKELFFGKRLSRYRTLLLSVCLFLAGSFFLFYPQIKQRGGIVNYNRIAKGSDKERIKYQEISFTMIKENPLLGVGFNCFVPSMQKYSKEPLSYYQFQPVHNAFLLLLAETGLVGGALFILFCGSTFVSLVRSQLDVYAVVLISIFVGYVFISCCDFYFVAFSSGKLMFFSLLGLMAFYTKKQRTCDNREKTS